MSQPTTPPVSGFAPFRLFGAGLPASIAWYQKVFQAMLAQGTLPRYGREWSGYAELLIEPRTGVAVGLHDNNTSTAGEFDGTRAGLDHISFQAQDREGLQARGDWPGSLGDHSSDQSEVIRNG
jgi:hypothetical protein